MVVFQRFIKNLENDSKRVVVENWKSSFKRSLNLFIEEMEVYFWFFHGFLAWLVWYKGVKYALKKRHHLECMLDPERNLEVTQ